MDHLVVDSEKLGAAEEVMSTAGIGRAALFGGALFDNAVGVAGSGQDCDLAVMGGSAERDRVRAALSTAGYAVAPWQRYFRMNLNEGCHIIEIVYHGVRLDLSFVTTFDGIGLFTIESGLLRLPEHVFDRVDEALLAWRERRLELRQPIEVQSPYLLLSRCCAIAAKYTLPLDTPENRSQLAAIEGAMRRWGRVHGGMFGGHDVASFVSTILRSIARSGDPRTFVGMLLDVGLIGMGSPDLEQAIELLALKWPAMWRPQTSLEVVRQLLVAVGSSAGCTGLRQDLRLLALRHWNITDRAIAQIGSGYEDG